MDKNKIIKILNEVNPEISNYKGNNLLEDHIIDSFDIIEIIAEMEDAFDIDIDPELIVEERFLSMGEIVRFIEEAVMNQK